MKFSPPILVFSLAFMLIASAQQDDFHKLVDNPVLWTTSIKPVIDGFNRYELTIQLINPCALITNATIHPDLVKESRRICNMLYEQHIEQDLSNMCPHENEHRISKRFIIETLVIGLVSLTATTATGLGIVGWQIDELKDTTVAHAKQINVLSDAANKLQDQMINVTTLAVATSNKLDKLMLTLPASNFLTAKIMTMLSEGQYAIQESRSIIKHGEMPTRLFRYLNLTFPCGDKCNFNLGKMEKCLVGRNKIKLKFTAPVVNETLRILTLESFQLINEGNGQICVYDYNGPKEIMVSVNKKCMISKNVQQGAYAISPASMGS